MKKNKTQHKIEMMPRHPNAKSMWYNRPQARVLPLRSLVLAPLIRTPLDIAYDLRVKGGSSNQHNPLYRWADGLCARPRRTRLSSARVREE